MEEDPSRNDWAISTMSWYAIFIWFGASLFSQMAYMAINGNPYDANLLLLSAGPFAWVLIGVELVIWGVLALYIAGKLLKRLTREGVENVLSENPTPQA